MNQPYDILIIGGGMTGASLAIALSGHGLHVGLVEAAPLKVDAVPNYDDRGIALSHGSQRIFSALGLWDAMHAQAQPIEHIHVSEQGGFGFTHLHAAEENVPALGQVITARDLGAALLPALEQCTDVEIIAPARVQWVRVEDEYARIGLEDRELQSRLLIAADGGQSLVRNQLGFTCRRREYQQSAIIANITPGRPHGNSAWERFTGHGPMAMLPMTGGRCALVWTVADTDVGQVLSLNDRDFLARVQQGFGWRLGKLQRCGKRSAYPLSQLWVPEAVQHRAVVIGNAAHTLHPVAGQGFNLGLRDVAVLAEVLLQAVRQGQDPGLLDSLGHYQQWRKNDQRGVVEITNLLVRGFSNQLLPMKLARNLGVLGLETLPPARHAIARAAMGLHGRLPRLSRGLPL
ncbi:2-octaprenyl-6-methoxyphenyl hydroxylase [Thiolapillus sp.]